MTTKLVYTCDRETAHNMSYEKAAGTTTVPAKAGWLCAVVNDHSKGRDITVRKFREGQDHTFHFCSTGCLVGWLSNEIDNPVQEAKPETDQPIEEEPK